VPDDTRHLVEGVVGLSGTSAELERVYRAYGVAHERIHLVDGPAGYVMNHTPQTYLVDPGGTLRLQYNFDASAEDIADDLRWLLDQWPGEDGPAIHEGAWSRALPGPPPAQPEGHRRMVERLAEGCP
jgi:hypothetical protein